MKRLYILVFVTIVLLLGMGFNSSRAIVFENKDQIAYNSDNLLRLHILANSSSPEDQYIKRQVRDLIIREVRDFFGRVDNVEKAIEVTTNQLPTLENKIKEYLASMGKNISVKLEVGKYRFPIRTYGNITLPAGEYKALKVYLGQGEGNNWWCVLFPPLCLDNDEILLDGQNIKTNEKSDQRFSLAFSADYSQLEVEYRFKFLEMFKEVPQWVKSGYLSVLQIPGSQFNTYTPLD